MEAQDGVGHLELILCGREGLARYEVEGGEVPVVVREGPCELERLLGRRAGRASGVLAARGVELEELGDAGLAGVRDAAERAGEVLEPREGLRVDGRAAGQGLRVGGQVGLLVGMAGLGEEARVLVEDLEGFLKSRVFVREGWSCYPPLPKKWFWFWFRVWFLAKELEP